MDNSWVRCIRLAVKMAQMDITCNFSFDENTYEIIVEAVHLSCLTSFEMQMYVNKNVFMILQTTGILAFVLVIDH